jgi:fermentation-respiration switch protein FrsA (DUF1100 family)
MSKQMIGNALLILVGFLLLNGLMFLQQPRMAFFPFQELQQAPSDWGLDYEDVHFQTEDGIVLHGWYIPHAAATRTLLFFHGNAGNISHRGRSIEIFHGLGLNVLIFDYRGYGMSQGAVSESGLYLDARAAWDYLVADRNTDPGEVILFGRSLGGIVAAALASQVNASALIMESVFSSARDVAHALFPVLSRLVYIRYGFDAVSKVEQVRYPVLVLHSPEDEIIPYALGEKVFAAANEPKFMVRMRGDHNGGFLLSQPRYSNALDAFIRSLPNGATLGRLQ